MFSCFSKSSKNENNKNVSRKTLPSVAVHSDIVYFKFLNAETYELDVSKIQVFIFDKNSICVHASNNNEPAINYINKHIDNINLNEEASCNFNDLHKYALDGVETKRSIIINNELLYIEARSLYYNQDIHDIYASMLIMLPYKIVSTKINAERYNATQ